MADPEIRIPSIDGDPAGDMEMIGVEAVEVIEVLETGPPNGEAIGEELAAEDLEKPAPRATFVDYLKSPIIELLVGTGEERTLLTAHQALLVQSPFFSEVISQFEPESTTRRITLASEHLDAVGSFLQYLYTGEYFPRKIDDSKLEEDPSIPKVDDTGDQLLRHARIYTLAEKLGLPELKSLSHSKIHRVTSTARGEIAYARYVYAHTPRSDTTMRKPVALFWGLRSHTLRHDAEDDFRQMCLEFPEFGFDVLSFVLDAKERRGEKDVGDGVGKSGRKRARV